MTKFYNVLMFTRLILISRQIIKLILRLFLIRSVCFVTFPNAHCCTCCFENCRSCLGQNGDIAQIYRISMSQINVPHFYIFTQWAGNIYNNLRFPKSVLTFNCFLLLNAYLRSRNMQMHVLGGIHLRLVYKHISISIWRVSKSFRKDNYCFF